VKRVKVSLTAFCCQLTRKSSRTSLCSGLQFCLFENFCPKNGFTEIRFSRVSFFLPSYSNLYPTRCNVTQCVLSKNCSTCFGWYLHPSSGAQETVSTASGICHTVIAICCYLGSVGTGLSVLWVTYATHSTLKPGAENLAPLGIDPRTVQPVSSRYTD
jgi:hypothetical protein